MAVTTKKQFAATTNATTTVFSPVSIQLNNQDDLDVYVTLSGGTRVLQLRQSTGSTAQPSHPQVNNTNGLYFPAVSAGTTLYNYTLSSDNNTITFNSALPSGAVVFCERRTRDADSSYTSFASGSTIRATDLNNSSTESNFTAQDARNKALTIEGVLFNGDQPNTNFVTTSHIVDGTIATADIADSAITSAKLADGTIVSGDIANNAVVTDKLNNLAVTTAKVADGAITSAKLASGTVATGDIAADAITGAKIADDQINSEHYVDGSIDTAHIADSQITSAKIADGTIVAGDLANDAVTTGKILDDNVTADKLAHTSVTAGSYTAADITVDAQGRLTSAASGTIATNEIANSAVTASKIASNAVTTDKIADGELTTLAGMQSTTASNLASATALTASTAELNQLDGITLETSVTTSSDTRIPTSKAVNDLVLSVTNALGGFVAIANETSFPTANPDPSNNAGTVVSISQLASGLAVNGSGVATISNGAGSGNTVTITGFPTSLVSQTLPASSGLQVQTTSTLHTYTFHKQLASAADIQAISATVNSFSARYRVSASAPTSSLDGGDLWYDTTNSKLMVYSSQNSAWEESSAIGNFFISTISSSSSTGGGSATANGTAYRFTISDAPVSAQQLIVSVDGVIQKPNAGSSQPSEGFVLVGNDIIFGSAPANGASMFVTVIGSTVGIGTPSNNTVTTAILQNGSVTTAKIVDANVTTAKITDANVTTAKIADDAVTSAKIADVNVGTSHIAVNAVVTNRIADDAVTADKLASSAVVTASIVDANVTTAKIADDAVTAAKLANTSVTAGSYGSSTSIPSITVDAQGRITAASGNTVNTDLVGDTSPQLGGTLDTNGQDITFNGAQTVSWDSSAADFIFNDYAKLNLGTDKDFKMYQAGNNTILQSSNTSGGVYLQGALVQVGSETGEVGVKFIKDGAVELYHDNTKRFETTANGVEVSAGRLDVGSVSLSGGGLALADNDKVICGSGDDLQIYHDGSHSYLKNSTGSLQVLDGTSEKFRVSGTGTSFKDDIFLANDNDKINFGDQNDLKIYHDGTDSRITSDTGALRVGVTNTNSLKLFTTNSTRWEISSVGHFVPDSNNSFDIGSTSNRVRNIYTNDLHLSNEGSSNDVDSTWGDWTIQEGESDLFLKNNRSGKKYKFNLTEVS